MGCVIAIAALARCLALPIFGALSDRLGRKPALTLALSSFFLGTVSGLVAVLTKSIVLLLLSRLLNGIGAGGYSVAQATIADTFSGAQKIKTFALLNACCGAGYVIGPLFGRVLFGSSFLPFAFLVFLSFGNLLLMACLFKEPQTHRAKRKLKTSFLGTLRESNLRPIFGMLFIFCLGWGFFCECLPIFLMHRFHFNSPEIGSFYIYSGIMITFCQGVGVRPFADHFSPKHLLFGGLAALAMTVPSLLLIHSIFLFYVVLAPIVLFQTFVFPSVAALLSNATACKEQGEVLGVFQSIQAVGMALGPLLLGSLINRMPILPILAGAAASTIALGWLIFVASRVKGPV